MFEAEAIRLRDILLGQGRDAVSPLLNLGSSTRAFREIDKPHIHAGLFGPLERAGIEVVHSDLKAGEGIHVSGDIADPAVLARLKAMKFKSVLIANMLEHVRDRAAVAAACEEIVGPGGLILATVPSSFPYHADPIDTLYRPAPTALASLFARSRVLVAETVAGQTYAEQIQARGSSLLRELGATARAALTFMVRPKAARARLSRWRWYRRRYFVSIALVAVSQS